MISSPLIGRRTCPGGSNSISTVTSPISIPFASAAKRPSSRSRTGLVVLEQTIKDSECITRTPLQRVKFIHDIHLLGSRSVCRAPQESAIQQRPNHASLQTSHLSSGSSPSSGRKARRILRVELDSVQKGNLCRNHGRMRGWRGGSAQSSAPVQQQHMLDRQPREPVTVSCDVRDRPDPSVPRPAGPVRGGRPGPGRCLRTARGRPYDAPPSGGCLSLIP